MPLAGFNEPDLDYWRGKDTFTAEQSVYLFFESEPIRDEPPPGICIPEKCFDLRRRLITEVPYTEEPGIVKYRLNGDPQRGVIARIFKREDLKLWAEKNNIHPRFLFPEVISTQLELTEKVLSKDDITITIPHMTKALETLFRVMWSNWSNYDSRRPPKQVNIAREIDAALGWGKRGDPRHDPSRDAKTLAKIIKPDTLDSE